MRYIIILICCLGLVSCNSTSKEKRDTAETKQPNHTKAMESKIAFADNPVIAHRGAWKAKGFPKNSIAALKEAINLKCTGSEFDVRMTSDEVLIVTHDGDFGGLVIDSTTYDELAKHKLPNGETLPTLRDFIKAGMTNNASTGLVCEIKPSKIEGRNKLMAEKAVALVKELKAEAYVSYYISFSYEIIKRIKEINGDAKVLYLDGSKTPQELKNDNITGLDYLVWKLKQKPEWITEAKNLDLKLNAWTANKQEDIDWLLAQDFDYITTDEPELAFERLKVVSN
ncbi:glycerophosphodiester phosphodiesterase [Winogradskyella forsetii]|uniref:glycerophosphodiester phosphodiesterase n=1 Tax=Winogradskyella forsetii TaxID=2686077 RepID=UPI002119B208|nr:glycerophosphodiester phosphodiesterase family protein [Winogradskyella forsetii]